VPGDDNELADRPHELSHGSDRIPHRPDVVADDPHQIADESTEPLSFAHAVVSNRRIDYFVWHDFAADSSALHWLAPARLFDDGVHQRSGILDSRVRIRVRHSRVRRRRNKLRAARQLRHRGPVSIDRPDSRAERPRDRGELGKIVGRNRARTNARGGRSRRWRRGVLDGNQLDGRRRHAELFGLDFRGRRSIRNDWKFRLDFGNVDRF